MANSGTSGEKQIGATHQNARDYAKRDTKAYPRAARNFFLEKRTREGVNIYPIVIGLKGPQGRGGSGNAGDSSIWGGKRGSTRLTAPFPLKKGEFREEVRMTLGDISGKNTCGSKQIGRLTRPAQVFGEDSNRTGQ